MLPGSFGTFAGLGTDPHSRVLDAEGEPIPGLYAAGSDQASVMGGHYPSGGINLGPAMTFGYLAGRHAAGVDGVPGRRVLTGDALRRGARKATFRTSGDLNVAFLTLRGRADGYPGAVRSGAGPPRVPGGPVGDHDLDARPPHVAGSAARAVAVGSAPVAVADPVGGPGVGRDEPGGLVEAAAACRFGGHRGTPTSGWVRGGCGRAGSGTAGDTWVLSVMDAAEPGSGVRRTPPQLGSLPALD